MVKLILLGFLILASLSIECDSDSDCENYNYCESGKCKHKEIFPLASLEILGSLLLFFLGLLSSAGGVGGGIISTGFSLLLFRFDAHMAVALTQNFAFAASITPIVLKFKARHPKLDRPLIYYDLIMQIASPLLMGVSVGVLFNPSLPSWLILAILTLLLAYVTVDIAFKGIKMYKKESMLKKIKNQVVPLEKMEIKVINPKIDSKVNENNKEIVESTNNNAESEDPQEKMKIKVIHPEIDLKLNENNKEFVESSNKNAESEEESLKNSIKESEMIASNNINKETTSRAVIGFEENKKFIILTEVNEPEINKELEMKLANILKSEKLNIHWSHVAYFTFLIAFSILMSLIRGKSPAASIVGIKSCSGEYFGVVVVYIIVMIILALLTSLYLIKKNKLCEKANYTFDEGDVIWRPKTCVIVSTAGFLIGFLVGILGLGSGFIIGPILIHLGVRPEVSTISSSLIICISSVTASVQYLVFGMVDWKYGLWYMFLAVSGASGGILGLRQFVIKKGRTSVLIIILSFVSLIALVVIPTVGIMSAIKENNNGTFQLGFKSLC